MIPVDLKGPDYIDVHMGEILKMFDPTVPDWARQPEPPKYTAEEVGAIPVPDSSLAGWFLQVSEVDENNKPIAVKAVNPSAVPGMPVVHNCDTIDVGPLYVWDETDEYYFTDHAHDPTVPEGQIHMYGNVPAGVTGGYALMNVEYAPVGKTVKIEVDMKIDSLMTPSRQPMWRGFIWEYAVPGSPTLYFVIAPHSDADGNNAKLMVSQKVRGDQDVAQPLTIKYGEFQKWEIVFDRTGVAKFYIDGEKVLVVSGITAEHTKTTSKLEIRNCMMNVASGYNSVYFDNIIIADYAEETDPTVPAWAKAPKKPTYTAAEVGAQPKGDYVRSPASAYAGQMILVKEVDKSGKPTAWEAANLPGVLLDHNCDSIDGQRLKATKNNMPYFYFADHSMDESIPEGQIHMGSAKDPIDYSYEEFMALPSAERVRIKNTFATHEEYIEWLTAAKDRRDNDTPYTMQGTNGYAVLQIPFTPTDKAVKMEFSIRIDSLINVSKNEMWRGFIFEYATPGSPSLYFVITYYNDVYSLLKVSLSERGTEGVVSQLIKMGSEFHKFTVAYDGVSRAVFYVDGEELLVADGITAPHTRTTSTLEIRNCMVDVDKGFNSVYFDHIKIVDDPMPGIVKEVLAAIPVGDEVAY